MHDDGVVVVAEIMVVSTPNGKAIRGVCVCMGVNLKGNVVGQYTECQSHQKHVCMWLCSLEE